MCVGLCACASMSVYIDVSKKNVYACVRTHSFWYVECVRC